MEKKRRYSRRSHHRNLFLRNGIYQFKKMINGQLIRFSLWTNNLSLAENLRDIILKERFSEFRKLKDNKSLKKAQELDLINKRTENLEQVWNEYFKFKELENLSTSQMNIKRKVFQDFLKNQITSIDDFTQSNINNLMSIYKKKYHDDSTKKYVSEIKCFLNFCVRSGYFTRENYDRLSWPKLRTKVNSTVISKSDLEKIFKYTKQNDKDFFFYLQALYFLSCRPSEVLALKNENFDFSMWTCKIWMNKTKKFKNVLIVNNEFCQLLIEYFQNKTNDYLCERHESKEYYSKKFKQLKIQLGLNSSYTLYSFRKSSASHLFENTKDIKFVSNQLGDNQAMAMKHYIHFDTNQYLQKYQNSL